MMKQRGGQVDVAKNRMPLMASEKFMERMKNLQKKIRMASGDDVSMRKLTEDIISTPLFEEIEKNLLKNKGDINVDLRIKFDRRFK